MLNRRAFVCGAMFTTALVSIQARAQTPRKVYRIAVLTPTSPPQLFDPLIAALNERGRATNRDVVIDIHLTGGDPRRVEALTRKLAEERVDVLVTNFTATAMAARRATSTIPIVMLTSGFPVEGGLAQSLARPGGNVTGMTIYAGGGPLFGKFVELLRDLVPSLRDLGVLWGYAPPSYRPEQVAPATEALRRAANSLNLNLRFWQTGQDKDVESALQAAAGAPLDALFVTAGVIHGIPDVRAKIVRFVLERRLPMLSDFDGSVFLGCGVLAYSVDWMELVDRTVNFVEQILAGAKPGDIPIEQPTKYKLSVNLKTARAIGLTIPPSLLLRADQVIE